MKTEKGQLTADPALPGDVRSSSDLWRAPAEAPPRRRKGAKFRHVVRPRLTVALCAAADAMALTAAVAIVALIAPKPFSVWTLGAALFTLATAPLSTSPGLTAAAQTRRLVLFAFAAHVALLLIAILIGAMAAPVALEIGLSAVLCGGLLLLARATLHEVAARRRWWGWPVAVLADDPAVALRVLAALRLHPEMGLKPVAVLRSNCGGAGACEGLRVVHGPDAVNRLRRHLGVAQVVSMGAAGHELLLLRIEVATPHFAKMSLFRRLAPLIGIHPIRPTLVQRPQWSKRALDLVATVAGMTVAIPLLLLVAALIKLDSQGPVIFRQKRPGKHGRPFRIFKFRTMFVGANRMHKSLSSELLKEFETYGKIRRDPRVTTIGRWLRRTSLDELPQIGNVLLGNMSLVGPRPHLMHQRRDLVEHHAQSLRATPGITGLWQTSGRSTLTFDVRLDIDAYYAEVSDLWLDLYILARTVVIVLSGKGAY